MRKHIYFLVALIAIGFSSCEEEGPIIILEESQIPLVDTSYVSGTALSSVPANVLFEEFSGVRCANCPNGNEETHNLVVANPGRVVPVTVHSDFLAAPYENSPDLRNEDANILANTLGPVGSKPSCFINRKLVNGQRLINSPGTWNGLVDNELNLQSDVAINLEIVSYDIVERSFRYKATLEYAAAATSHNLGFYITESEIIAEQLNLTVKIEDYEHEYILRKSLTPVIGDPITTDIVANTVIIKEFRVDLDEFDADKVWNLEHMHLVAFIRQANDEIVQAATVDLVP